MSLQKTERGRRSLHARVQVLAEFRFRLRQFLSFSEEAAEAIGTSAQQYQLLQVIEAAPEGVPASISYIAERMVLRHNSADELVGRAERTGLVRREEDASDHRRALITLTEAGHTTLATLVAQHWVELEQSGLELRKALDRLLVESLSPRKKSETQ